MEDETDRAPVTPPPRPMTHQSHRTVPCPITPLGARSSIRKTRSPAFRVPTLQTPTTPIREALENVALRLTAQRLGVAPARDPLMPRKLNGNARIFGPSDAFPLLRYLGTMTLAMETLEGDHHRQYANFPEVAEFIVAEEFLLCLTKGGICIVYNRDTMQRIGKLNNVHTTALQIVRSLFYNRANQSVILVTLDASDSFSAMKCYSIPLFLLRRGKLNLAQPILTNENLSFPGFVEFDDVNQKILSLSIPSNGENRPPEYRVWNLSDYCLMYTLPPSNDIVEVKISPGAVLIINTKSKNTIPLKILDIHSGALRRELSPLLKQNCRLELVELFNDKLLLKQQQQPLRIIDIRSLSSVTAPHFATPSSFIYLFEKNLFLAFNDTKLSAWNFAGDVVASFPDLISSGRSNVNVCISRTQSFLVAACAAPGEVGRFHLCDAVTAKVLGTLSPLSTSAPVQSMIHISSMLYDEDRQVLYVGNTFGAVSVWGVRSYA